MKLYGIKWWIAFGSIFYVFIGSVAVEAQSKKGEKKVTISTGRKVSIQYTLRMEDKAVIDTNVGSKPLTYIHGSHQIIPGLEKALEGMNIGDIKQVTVKPEEGYGVINKEAFLEVKKEQVPSDALKIGAELQGQDAAGRIIHARVTEIKKQTVMLDFNHPLAGKTLHFDVKVLDVQEAPVR